MKTVLLGDVVDLNPTTSLKKEAETKFVSMDKLQPFTRKISGFEEREYKGGSKFKNGDTLLARITPCLENGKTAFVDILQPDEIGAGSTEFVVMRAKASITTPDYVYYLSISPEFRKYAIQSMVGTSGRQRVQNDSLARLELELPDLKNQEKVGSMLAKIDEIIELNRCMNKTLEQIGQALFRHYFIDNPEADDWEIRSLDQIADFLNGVAMQKYPAGDGPTLPVIKIREMSAGITSNTDVGSADIPEQYIVNDGDILFSWSGTLIVKPWCGGKGALNQHLFKVTSTEYPKWFYYYWTKYHLQSFIETAAEKATTMGHIQRRHLTDAKVKVPSEDKLVEIGNIIEPILDQQITNDLEAQKLASLRDSLLPQLISGKLKV